MKLTLKEARELIYILESIEDDSMLLQIDPSKVDALEFLSTALLILTAAEETELAGQDINYLSIVSNYALDYTSMAIDPPDVDVLELLPDIIEAGLLTKHSDSKLVITNNGYELLRLRKEARYIASSIEKTKH